MDNIFNTLTQFTVETTRDEVVGAFPVVALSKPYRPAQFNANVPLVTKAIIGDHTVVVEFHFNDDRNLAHCTINFRSSDIDEIVNQLPQRLDQMITDAGVGPMVYVQTEADMSFNYPLRSWSDDEHDLILCLSAGYDPEAYTTWAMATLDIAYHEPSAGADQGGGSDPTLMAA